MSWLKFFKLKDLSKKYFGEADFLFPASKSISPFSANSCLALIRVGSDILHILINSPLGQKNGPVFMYSSVRAACSMAKYSAVAVGDMACLVIASQNAVNASERGMCWVVCIPKIFG